MPVPALFRYRKRVFLGRSSEGPHQVVKIASRAPRARPVYRCLVAITRSSNQGRRESDLGVADGSGAVLAAAPSIVAPVQGAVDIPDPRGVCASGLVLFEPRRVSPPGAVSRVPLLPLRVSSAGTLSPACKPLESLRSSLGALLPPFRLLTRREGGRCRSLPPCAEDIVSGKVQQGTGPVIWPHPAQPVAGRKARTVVPLLHFGRAEFHR